MDMVIVSTICDDGMLMEQYLVREADGKELFDSLLRRYKSSGFKVVNGGNNPTILQNGCMKLRIYTREREVI